PRIPDPGRRHRPRLGRSRRDSRPARDSRRHALPRRRVHRAPARLSSDSRPQVAGTSPGDPYPKESEMATKTKTRTFATRIDIPEENRDRLVELLNARLADTFDLYSQVKQAHWNVKGSDFIQLHLLYDTVAEDVIEFVDTIAERATALGGL